MAKHKRALYQCSHARVLGNTIRCDIGYPLNPKEPGIIHTLRLKRGTPLEFGICQQCNDYDEMGPPIPKSERGW
jgi:hypothetical protein